MKSDCSISDVLRTQRVARSLKKVAIPSVGQVVSRAVKLTRWQEAPLSAGFGRTGRLQ